MKIVARGKILYDPKHIRSFVFFSIVPSGYYRNSSKQTQNLTPNFCRQSKGYNMPKNQLTTMAHSKVANLKLVK